MSLLFTSIDPRHVCMVSDSHVDGRANESFPKFQILHDVNGRPIFVGGTGLRQPLAQLFCLLPRMLRETGRDLATLADMLPGGLRHLLEKRDPATIDRQRDLIHSPLDVVVAGYDSREKRLRAWLMLANGVGTGTVHELAQTDCCAIGFLQPQDSIDLMPFTKNLKENGRRLGPQWVARECADQIDRISELHGEVGHAAFAAGLDHKGLIDVSDLPLPWSVCEARERAIALLSRGDRGTSASREAMGV